MFFQLNCLTNLFFFPGDFIFSTPDFTDLSYSVAPQMAAFAQKALQKIDVAAGTSGIGKEENCLDQFCLWKKCSMEMHSDLQLKKKG